MVANFAKGVSWLWDATGVAGAHHYHAHFFWLPKASAKDVVAGAQKTERLLKRHGPWHVVRNFYLLYPPNL